MEAAASPDSTSPEPPLYEDRFLTVDPTGIKGKGAEIPISSMHFVKLKRPYDWHNFFKPLLKLVFALPLIWIECQGPSESVGYPHPHPSSGSDKFMFYVVFPMGIIWFLVTGYKQLVKCKGYNVVFYGGIGGVTRLGDYTKETGKAIITAIQQAQFLSERKNVVECEARILKQGCKVGDIYNGKVVEIRTNRLKSGDSFIDFAFLEIGNGVKGSLHCSEMTGVERDAAAVGTIIRVKVKGYDTEGNPMLTAKI